MRGAAVTPEVNWPVSYIYNGNGHLASQTWHGLTIGFAPNGLGQPTQAGTYATGVTYHPNGAIKQFTYGNGIVHSMVQDARLLPARSTDTVAGSTPLDMGYTYDNNANVATITDYVAGARQTRSMGYDNLDRLTQATSSMFGTASYGYNVLDNLTTVNVTGGSKARNQAYVYDLSNRLVGVTAGGSTVVGLGYDVQGNLANKNGVLHSFDFGNRLRTVTDPVNSRVSTYAYDGQGRRVKDMVNGAAKHSQYLNNGQLVLTSDANTVDEYVYLQGSLLAIRSRDIATSAYTTKYQHTDALGTPIAVTSQSRALLETSEYEPFGQQVNAVGAPKNGPGYTGNVQDGATGLTYMQQRYYDPQIGRFLSVDPVTAYSSGDMRHFNVYAYAYNNPYKFTDPDGRAPPGCGDGTCESAGNGNFWVGVAKGVRDSIAPIAHAIADPYGNNIDPSYDRIGPGEGQVEKGGYKFGGALAAAEGLKLPAKGAGVIAKGEAAVSLTEAQAKNLGRFNSKLPAGNTGTTVSQTGKGVTFSSDVPGNVPGSKATYQKSVDASGTTTGYTKTTVAPNSQIIHVKDKLNP